MSRNDGWKALNMEFSGRIPRTEYSAHSHWALAKKVTGINTDIEDNRQKASREFVKKWDYSFMWNVLVGRLYLEKNGGRITRMGHAVYAEGGTDYNDEITNPFEDIEDAFSLDPCKEYGEFDKMELVKDFENNYKNRCEMWGDTLCMSGVYITMISGLIEIFGWDTLLLAMGMDQDRFAKVVDGYYHWVKQFFDAYAETDIPVMMIHDDMVWTSGPFASPDWYRKHIFPKFKKLWAPVKEAGKKIIFTSDGTYTEFFDDIVDCGADMLVMEPTSDMELFAKKYGKTHGFVGNADCRILLDGSKDDIRKEVERCVNIGRNCPGFIMAVGNHIPANTPVDNALWYNEAFEKLRDR